MSLIPNTIVLLFLSQSRSLDIVVELAIPSTNYSTQKDIYGFRPTSLLCKKNKAIIEYLISLIIERENEVMPIFRTWII